MTTGERGTSDRRDLAEAELIADTARSTRRRAELERHAAVLFLAAASTMAIVCGAVIVSGWFAGVLVDRWERLFWAGALLGGVMVAVFAAAAAPGGADARRATTRIAWLLRIGLALFVAAPALCVVALIGDFYRL
ncbi:hypothetical protein [Herbiconiux sp. UC225_62]|uniref:hypothetical protein n=1 Tax=Herbiconiux sp. UC225_62 TaxID=3350168 RepID=UPI0036D36F30